MGQILMLGVIICCVIIIIINIEQDHHRFKVRKEEKKQMNDKIVFISGPYSGTSKIWCINIVQRARNIYRARKAAKMFWRRGYAVICPHMNSAFFDKCAPYDIFINGYLDILERCDIIFILKGWAKSSGAIKEIANAKIYNLEFMYERKDG
jgi:hypothetical protein